MKSIALALCFVWLAGCGGAPSDKEAVRQGIIDHLAGKAGLDVGSMDISVTTVSFSDGEAEATVAFQAKGSSDPASGMQMNYTLERKGNRWVVKGKSGAGDGTHGGGMESPHGGAPPRGELPQGHPPVDSPTDSPG